MAEITAKVVNELRQRTGVGMMDCKKALVETDGDMEAAVDLLRKSGLAKAAKKAGREANEGLIRIFKADDRHGAMIILNSETDFVARNEKFQELCDGLVRHFATVELQDGLALSTSADVLFSIADGRGPRRSLICLGYAGWDAGQLEAELADNAWLTCPFDADILFNTASELRLEAAAAKLRVNLSLLTSQAGHA